VRTAVQAMAAVLGGCQSLHTNSLDEAYALPSEEAVRLALRTQQVIAHESGVPAEPDPFGGSYFLERLTDEMETAANHYILRIDDMRGMIPAIEHGFPQAEIARASYEYQRSIETEEQIIVGVNRFTGQEEKRIEVLEIGESSAQRQLERLAAVKRTRNHSEVLRALSALRHAAQGTENTTSSNTMPFILDAVRAYATVGEIAGALKDVFGGYTESSVF
jgi:methylmalonyl-CoA mutase N-terminal domain/subunit